MTDKSLRELYAAHQGKVSDKWALYLTEYDRIFTAYRNKPINLLEIGIQNGGSLEISAQYFSEAIKLVGCDINEDCKLLRYDDSRIAVVVNDANTDVTEQEIISHASCYDVIVDDGSHSSSDIIKTFARYFKYLNDGGVFIVEDLHCAYWQEFEGGLFDPYSSISFFKRLADIVNCEHWGINKTPIDLLAGLSNHYGVDFDFAILAHVHSIEFINSMCVIRKNKPVDNVLGQRIISGVEEAVVKGHFELRGALSEPRDQKNNFWAERVVPPDEELPHRLDDLVEARKCIDNLRSDLIGRNEQINHLNTSLIERNEQIGRYDYTIDQLRSSVSWRITSPMRFLSLKIKNSINLIALLPRIVRHGGGINKCYQKACRVLSREGWPGIKQRILFVGGYRHGISGSIMIRPDLSLPLVARNNYTEWVSRYDTLSDLDRENIKIRINSLPSQPLISVIMPVYDPPLKFLEEVIESIHKQLYSNWELCIADDASKNLAVRELLDRCAAKDARIKIVYRQENGHISKASNSALELASGEFIALVDNDDLLPEHALFYMAEAINNNSDAALLYSDEDKISESGVRTDPYFKCDWNPELFLGHNLITHLGVYKTDIVRKIGGFRVGFEGAQDYDLAARFVEQIKSEQIIHIPRILYHWRVLPGSTAQSIEGKPYALNASEKALNEHLSRRGINGHVEGSGYGHRVFFDLPEKLPLVSIIIPTKNAADLVRTCVNSIYQLTSYKNFEIILVDNGSDDKEALGLFTNFTNSHQNFRVIRDDRPFNYSALNNLAVNSARGEFILLMNNDIEVISPNWLNEMLAIAVQENIGAVGAKLLYPDNTVQHAGVILGIGGWAGHAHKGFPAASLGYVARAGLMQNFSAVTGACLLVSRKKYIEVGGLNEKDLAVACNDVDFCLKLKQAGYRNVWTPHAQLYHHESATRGYEDTPEKHARFVEEVNYMKRNWGGIMNTDPAYNPNLTLDAEDFGLAWPPRNRRLVPE